MNGEIDLSINPSRVYNHTDELPVIPGTRPELSDDAAADMYGGGYHVHHHHYGNSAPVQAPVDERAYQATAGLEKLYHKQRRGLIRRRVVGGTAIVGVVGVAALGVIKAIDFAEGLLGGGIAHVTQIDTDKSWIGRVTAPGKFILSEAAGGIEYGAESHIKVPWVNWNLPFSASHPTVWMQGTVQTELNNRPGHPGLQFSLVNAKGNGAGDQYRAYEPVNSKTSSTNANTSPDKLLIKMDIQDVGVNIEGSNCQPKDKNNPFSECLVAANASLVSKYANYIPLAGFGGDAGRLFKVLRIPLLGTVGNFVSDLTGGNPQEIAEQTSTLSKYATYAFGVQCGAQVLQVQYLQKAAKQDTYVIMSMVSQFEQSMGNLQQAAFFERMSHGNNMEAELVDDSGNVATAAEIAAQVPKLPSKKGLEEAFSNGYSLSKVAPLKTTACKTNSTVPDMKSTESLNLTSGGINKLVAVGKAVG